MRGAKARIAVAGLQPIVAEIFAISRFDKVLEVFPSCATRWPRCRREALAAYDAA